MAVSIRVLLHDTRNSKSLLGLLDYKQNMGFLDSAYGYEPENLLTHTGLVGFRFEAGKNPTYYAPMSDRLTGASNKYVFFAEWWNKVVIVDSKKNKFNRRDLILNMADTDGGAHVDPELNESYVELTRNNSVNWIFLSDNKPAQPLMDVELFSVRQIAYELINSIERWTLKQTQKTSMS